MFRLKRLKSELDEWKKLAQQLEADLNACKGELERAENDVSILERDCVRSAQELEHARDKLSLAMRALYSERERDAIMKNILDVAAVTPPKPFIIKTDGLGGIVKPEDA